MSALEELLREELRTVAGSAGEPVVRTAALARAGERVLRRRRTRVVLVAAAAILVVLGGIGVAGRLASSAPRPVDPANPSPSGEGAVDELVTSVPYWLDGELRVGDEVVEMRRPELTYAAGTVLVDVSDRVGGVQWSRLGEAMPLVPLVSMDDYDRPRLSPDGTVVAWIQRSSVDRWLLQVTDAAGGDFHDSTLVPQVGAEPRLLGVDSQRRVFVDVPGRGTVLWTPMSPGGALVDVTGLPRGAQVNRTWGDGVAFLGPGGGEPFGASGVYGSVDDQGRFERLGEVTTYNLGLWSPDQQTWAYAGDDEGGPPSSAPPQQVYVQGAGSTDVRSMDLPEDTWTVAGWDGDGSVVVSAPGRGVLVCSVESLDCRQVGGTAGTDPVVPSDYLF